MALIASLSRIFDLPGEHALKLRPHVQLATVRIISSSACYAALQEHSPDEDPVLLLLRPRRVSNIAPSIAGVVATAYISDSSGNRLCEDSIYQHLRDQEEETEAIVDNPMMNQSRLKRLTTNHDAQKGRCSRRSPLWPFALAGRAALVLTGARPPGMRLRGPQHNPDAAAAPIDPATHAASTSGRCDFRPRGPCPSPRSRSCSSPRNTRFSSAGAHLARASRQLQHVRRRLSSSGSSRVPAQVPGLEAARPTSRGQTVGSTREEPTPRPAPFAFAPNQG